MGFVFSTLIRFSAFSPFRFRGPVGLGMLVWLSCGSTVQGQSAEHNENPAELAKFFDEQVQPILAANCFKCHGAEEKVRGNLVLTNREGLLAGGDLGPSVIDDWESSPLLQAINYEGPEMPPSGQLPAAQIQIITQWIQAGATGLPPRKISVCSKIGVTMDHRRSTNKPKRSGPISRFRCQLCQLRHPRTGEKSD